jgi:hypothetical protein
MNSPAAAGKRVGEKGRIYVAPTWSESLSSGLKKGAGLYLTNRANKQESAGRETAANLAADSAEQRRQQQVADRNKEDERFQQMLTMFGTR